MKYLYSEYKVVADIDRDRSVGRASGFGPQGRGFESASCPGSDIGQSLVVVASAYQSVKLGPGLDLGNQS